MVLQKRVTHIVIQKLALETCWDSDSHNRQHIGPCGIPGQTLLSRADGAGGTH